MWDYTDKVKEHFLNPRNVGEISDPDGVGEVGSLACGDALKLFLKIEDDVIKDAKFLTFGCASAIAASSALTKIIIGKTVDEALKVSNQDIADYLGGLPKAKMHCSVMGQEALEAAIRNYRGEPPLEEIPEDQLVCSCFGVTEDQIIKAIKNNNLTTVEEVTNFTKAGGGCGNCLDDIAKILDSIRQPAGQIGDMRKEKAPAMTNIERMQKVMDVLENIIRPRLQQDGGDIELVDINGKEVSVALRGQCTNCPSSQLTIEGFIQETLQDSVEPDLVVKEVQ